MSGGSSNIMYFGLSTGKYDEIYFDVSTGTSMGDAEMDWEYWNGSSWSAFSPTNVTGAFDNAQVHSFTFTAPNDWATTSVNSEESSYYYTRATCVNSCQFLGLDQISVTAVSEESGASVPEFSTYMYLLTLGVTIFMINKHKDQLQAKLEQI